MEAIQQGGWTGQRSIGIVFGFGTQVLFLTTVWYLFWFLKDGVPGSPQSSLWWDAGLALQFVLPHSWLLHPATRHRITKFLAPEFYGCLFCVLTCLGLLITIFGWQGCSTVVWELDGAAGKVMTAGYYGSWIALLYSLSLTGFGHQTGLTSFLYWLRGEPQPRRLFEPRGAYLYLRHPVYLSLFGLMWFTPYLTIDHALLSGVWTIYVFIGSYLKDERLAFYYGDRYRDYQSRVTGYPLMGWGPMGIRRRTSTPDVVMRSELAPSVKQLS